MLYLKSGGISGSTHYKLKEWYLHFCSVICLIDKDRSCNKRERFTALQVSDPLHLLGVLQRGPT